MAVAYQMMLNPDSVTKTPSAQISFAVDPKSTDATTIARPELLQQWIEKLSRMSTASTYKPLVIEETSPAVEKLVLCQDDWDKFNKFVETPSPATPELIKLMTLKVYI
jgi:hypothetical protein